VWEPQRAELLMDSIYKHFRVGSLLLWRTKNRLKTERQLGVYELPPPDADYPVDYVLDGQQRLTSIFSTFQTSLQPTEADVGLWLPIYYDFSSQQDAQESRFVALQPDEADPIHYFPLNVFLEPVAFSKATATLAETQHEEIVKVQQRFLEALLPVQTFESEDRTSVAIVFERVNRMGIELDIFQLLTAWTWSDEFDLQARFAALAEEFSDFGFEAVGQDPDLMLRCAAAVLKRDPSPAALVSLNGVEVRESFDDVADAIRRAIDFMRSNFHVHHLQLLPYPATLIPLAAFFSVRPKEAMSDDERATLAKWFWRTCFSHRYSGNPQRNIRRDIEQAVKLREGEESTLAEVAISVDGSFFLAHQFNVRTVATRSFILLLAQADPRSFISGQSIKVDKVLAKLNRSEYHHCFPKAKLKHLPSSTVNALVNFAIISSVENKKISDKLPSEYRALMPADTTKVQEHAAIPDSLFENKFSDFIDQRAAMLAQWLHALVT